jgi:hypothetical protein
MQTYLYAMKTIISITLCFNFSYYCGSGPLEPHCRWMVEAIYSNQVTEDWRV